jgi:hypothetical protein
MMRPTVRVAAVLGVLVSAGCGLGLGGLADVPPLDAGEVMAALDAGVVMAPPEADTTDAGVAREDQGAVAVDANAGRDASPSVGDPCGASASTCVVVPSGWTLVAYATNRSSPCPPGFGNTPKDVVEAPDAGIACGCSACQVTAPPTCTSGSIAVSFDTQGSGPGQCGTTANPSPLKNSPPGACGTDLFTGDYSNDDVEYTAPPPAGGTCTSDGVASGASEGRACAPTTGAANCTGSVCKPQVTAPYEACIEAPGALACPSGALSVRHLVGAATCPPCACSVTGECSGTMTLFEDATCTARARPIPTGQCVPISGPGQGMGMGRSTLSYKSYEYAGGTPTNVACQIAGAAATPPTSLASPETVCCSK